MAMYDDLLRATRVPNFDPLPVITLMVAPLLYIEIHIEQHNDSLICVERYILGNGHPITLKYECYYKIDRTFRNLHSYSNYFI